MRIIFYIMLALGVVGLGRSVFFFFLIGSHTKDKYLDVFSGHYGYREYGNRHYGYRDYGYRELVGQAADFLVLIVGAFLFLWLSR